MFLVFNSVYNSKSHCLCGTSYVSSSYWMVFLIINLGLFLPLAMFLWCLTADVFANLFSDPQTYCLEQAKQLTPPVTGPSFASAAPCKTSCKFSRWVWCREMFQRQFFRGRNHEIHEFQSLILAAWRSEQSEIWSTFWTVSCWQFTNWGWLWKQVEQGAFEWNSVKIVQIQPISSWFWKTVTVPCFIAFQLDVGWVTWSICWSFRSMCRESVNSLLWW